MKRKRVILSAGGTGGHLFPAQAVAAALGDQCEILFVGGGLDTSPYFDRSAYPFYPVATTTFSLANPLQATLRTPKLIKGVVQSLGILSRFAPDAVVGFGSFYTLPILIAAKIRKVPLFLHEQNAVPGKVNRLFSPHARITGITFPESARHFKGKTEEVLFPMRKMPSIPAWSYFGLKPGKTTLLVFGGSQGARGINTLFLEAASHLKTPFQVLHFTGNEAVSRQARSLYAKMGISHVVKEFEERMDLALEVADLAFCRAGAATICELILSETPAIVVPFPLATENHQERNGAFFVEYVGGGALALEKETSAREAGALIDQFLEGMHLTAKERIRLYKSKREAKVFSDLILESI